MRTGVKYAGAYTVAGREVIGLAELRPALRAAWAQGTRHLARGYISAWAQEEGEHDLADFLESLPWDAGDVHVRFSALLQWLDPTAPPFLRGHDLDAAGLLALGRQAAEGDEAARSLLGELEGEAEHLASLHEGELPELLASWRRDMEEVRSRVIGKRDTGNLSDRFLAQGRIDTQRLAAAPGELLRIATGDTERLEELRARIDSLQSERGHVPWFTDLHGVGGGTPGLLAQWVCEDAAMADAQREKARLAEERRSRRRFRFRVAVILVPLLVGAAVLVSTEQARIDAEGVVWKTDLPAEVGTLGLATTVFDEHIRVTTKRGISMELDRVTGEVRWRAQTRPAAAAVHLADRTITLSPNGEYHALDEGGAHRWEAQDGIGSSHLVTSGDGVIAAVVDDGDVVRARNATDGSIRWERVVGPSQVVSMVAGRANGADSFYYLHGGPELPMTVVAVDASTGVERWRKAGEPSGPHVDRERLAHASGYIFHWSGGQLDAINAVDGGRMWRRNYAHAHFEVAVDAGVLLLDRGYRSTFGLDLDTGAVRWRRASSGVPVAEGDGAVYLADLDGSTVEVLNAATGQARESRAWRGLALQDVIPVNDQLILIDARAVLLVGQPGSAP